MAAEVCSIKGMAKRYIVNLSDEERVGLQTVVRGRHGLQKRKRAQILLKADEGWSDAEIAEELEVGVRTVERVRERCCVLGLEAAIEAKKPPRPPRMPKLDGVAQAAGAAGLQRAARGPSEVDVVAVGQQAGRAQGRRYGEPDHHPSGAKKTL